MLVGQFVSQLTDACFPVSAGFVITAGFVAMSVVNGHSEL